MSKYSSLETIALVLAVQKIEFFEPHFEGSWGSGAKKFRKTKLRLQLNNFTQKLNFAI